MARPFDLDRLELTGEPVPVAEQVRASAGTPQTGYFSASDTGVLLYQAEAAFAGSQLTWFDRSGKAAETVAERALYGDIDTQRYQYDVSANGQRFLVNTSVDQGSPAPITLVMNWTAGLRK